MPTLGLDADTILTPFAADIAAAGITRVARYLKNLTKEEVDALHAAGIGVILIFEAGSQNVLGGAAQGAIDGKRAFADAQVLGAPDNVAIYATADTDLGAEQAVGVASEYWPAFDAEIFPHYPIGGYADGVTLAALKTRNLVYTWLPDATGWEGYQDFLANGSPTMVQGPTLTEAREWAPHGMTPVSWPDLGFSYDPDLIMVEDCGAWLPA